MAIRVRVRCQTSFRTKAGFVGVGLGHIEAGDSVVFLFGMQRPFIVRPVDRLRLNDHVYTLVGTAAVPELADQREKLDKAYADGLFEEIDIHLN